MSLKTDKDNIYVIVPPVDTLDSITNFMKENFTIFVRVKIIGDKLPFNEDSFIFSRNGKHSGICVRRMENNDLSVSFSYWFSSNDGEDKNIYKNITFLLPNELKNEFNDYVMICDQERKIISCYINNINIGAITYSGLIKEDYSKSFIWFGCGSMIVENKYKGIGEFEFELSFALSDNININDIDHFKNTYMNYTKLLFDELPVFNSSLELKEKLIFFLDFDNKSKYKIWNYIFNGIFPQFYIENNIYF